MKRGISIIPIIGLFILAGCGNDHKLIFKETQCANPWLFDSNDANYKNNIRQYLNSHGVHPCTIEITHNDSAQVCLACHCLSGRNVEIWVDDEELGAANSLGFY